MARLGEMLLSEKIITSKELDSALEIHVLHGVKLGTCLVEMGFITDDELATCLGKKTGKVFLSKDQLIAVGGQNLSVISPVTIKKHRVIPVGIQGGALRIATDHDVSLKKQAELEKFLGRTVELITVSGYAVDCFLEQMFGVPRPGRFLTKYSRIEPPEITTSVVENENEAPAPIFINGVEWKSLSDVTQAEASARANDAALNATEIRDEAPGSLLDAAERMSHARSRDDVAKITLDYVSHSFETVALFIVLDGVVRGWKAISNRKKLQLFDAFSAPIETVPDVQQCVITKKPVIENTISAELKLLLQKPYCTGKRSAFFPIFIQQRVIAVLLCDGAEKMNTIETSELCRKASYALEILILRSKMLRS